MGPAVQELPGCLAHQSSRLDHSLRTFLEVPWSLEDPSCQAILSDLVSQDCPAFQYFPGSPSVQVFPSGLGLRSLPSVLSVHQVRAFLVLQRAPALRWVLEGRQDQSDLAVLSVRSLL